MCVKRIGRDGHDLLVAAIGIQHDALGIGTHQQFVINSFTWNEDHGEIQGAFVCHNILARDGVGVSLYGSHKALASLFAFSGQSPESIKWELRINREQLLVLEDDDGVGCFSTPKAILCFIERLGQSVLEQTLQCYLAKGSARLGAPKNVFQSLGSLVHLLARLLYFSQLLLNLAQLL